MRTLLRYILACARSFLVAIFTGAVITVFANTVTLGWELTQEYPMMILMIPLAAVLTVYIFEKAGAAYRKVTSMASFCIEPTGKSSKAHTNPEATIT